MDNKSRSVQKSGATPVSAVALEPELVFEGVVDRFDGLTERFEELFARPWCFCFGGGSDEADPSRLEVFLKGAALVSLVRHERLALAGYLGVGQHGRADVAFVGFGAGESERDR